MNTLCLLCDEKIENSNYNIKFKYCKNCKSKLKRAEHYKFKYNIEIADYNKFFDKQSGRCAICGIHQSELKRKLDVDHNHRTNEIRGLLCNNCNIGLGNFKDNEQLLKLAINYLQRSI